MVATMNDRCVGWCRRWLVGAWAWLGIIGLLPAQEKPPATPEPEEVEVLATGARELGAFAALALKNGFPVRARQAWLEVLAEYSTDDEDARKALGFYKHGSVWQRDEKFVYPDEDKLDAGVANMLTQRWQALAGRLGGAHRTVAEKLVAAGKKARADHHVQRALRFVPGDAKAIAAGGLRQFEGITGDDVDITVLQRSRLMDKAIAKLVEQRFEAPEVAEKLPQLDAIGATYKAVRSDHFTVYGDLDLAQLQEAAAWAERSLAFSQQAFEGFEGFPPKGQPSSKLVFLAEKETWDKLVRKHLPKDAEFLVANTRSVEIEGVETAQAKDAELVRDLAVRWIVQDWSGMRADALEEGVGHAVVGMFFGKNMVFSVGQQKDVGTVAGVREQKKLLLPDMETWKELAIEIAWQRSATPAAKLPLLKAAEFPTDARIKAWSFCDYLLRRDPRLLTTLQATRHKANHENEVLTAFQAAAGVSLLEVEDRWRRFWTEESPLRRAVVGKVTPLEAASKDAPEWLQLFNKLRAGCGVKPVAWSSTMSAACREHVEYLKANKDQRGPEKEHTQLAGRPGYSQNGRTLAPYAVVWTKDKKKAEETWLVLPGYRDAILDANIDTVGIYADGNLVVIDVGRGAAGGSRVITHVWPVAPEGNQPKPTVPAAVDVELLGPEVQRLLAANGRGKQKQIGCPLTLHGHGARDLAPSVKVTNAGAEVKGFLVEASGSMRWTWAPGMWVFYPAEPLPKGAELVASWRWKDGEYRVTFLAQ